MNAALTSILALIQQVLPLIQSASNATGLVASIITALEQWLPIVIAEGEALYTPVKNIIEQLKSSGAPTQAQIDALNQLDAKVDAAFEAATVGLDPDAS